MRLPRRLAVCAGVLVLGTLAPGPANANNWATGEIPYINLGAYQGYYYGSPGTNYTDATNWTRQENINPTDMYTGSEAHDYSHVHVQDDHYNATWSGLTTCPVYAGDGKCQHWHVKYDQAGYETDTDTERRTIACHETGHTTGLDHREYGCMESGQFSQVRFTDHDVAHINAAY